MWSSGGFEHWRRIGPLMPSRHPLEILAESLDRAFKVNVAGIVRELRDGDDALRFWLHERKADAILWRRGRQDGSPRR